MPIELKYFLLGFIAAYIILPLVDAILALAVTFLEVIKSLMALVIAKINHKITLEEEDESVKPARKIGFITDSDEEVGECDSET